MRIGRPTGRKMPFVHPDPEHWSNEKDPQLRHFKYIASNVDWQEWPGGAAEILSAYATSQARLQACQEALRVCLNEAKAILGYSKNKNDRNCASVIEHHAATALESMTPHDPE